MPITLANRRRLMKAFLDLSRLNHLDNLWTRSLNSSQLSEEDAKATASIGSEMSTLLYEALELKPWFLDLLRSDPNEVEEDLHQFFAGPHLTATQKKEFEGRLGNATDWRSFAEMTTIRFCDLAIAEAAELNQKAAILASGGHTKGDITDHGKCQLLYFAGCVAAISGEVAFAIYINYELLDRGCL